MELTKAETALTATQKIAQAERDLARIQTLKAFEFEPYDYQLPYFQSQAKTRCIFSANQVGKSLIEAVDDVMLATGTHPYRQWWNPPVYIRVVADGYKEMVDDFLVKLYRSIIHPKYLGGKSFDDCYAKGDRIFTFPNGSTIQFMSYKLTDLGQGPQKFAAVQLHKLRFEEQGPKEAWDENKIRLLRYGGCADICYTPLRGTRSWYYDEFYLPWSKGELSNVECFTGWKTDDNKSIPRESVESIFAEMSDEQVRIRRYGEWINLGGGVYAMWNPDIHFIPEDPARIAQATKSVIIDPHPSKATAVLWCGVGADERMFAYREYREKKTIPEICDDIRRLSGKEDIRRFLIDPHWGWTVTELGKSYQQQFHDNGIPVQESSNDKWGGIELMRTLLSPSPTLRKASFEVMHGCPRLAWEFQHYSFREQTGAARQADRWATVDSDDDLVTCARYFVQSNPRFMGQTKSSPVQVLNPVQSKLVRQYTRTGSRWA